MESLNHNQPLPSPTPSTQSQLQIIEIPSPPSPQPQKQLTCIERATLMVDGISDSLYLQIIEGMLRMNKRKKLPADEETEEVAKKKSVLLDRVVDVDEHKRMIRKFMRMNRKTINIIKERSIQIEETVKKQHQDEVKKMNEQRNKTLEQRRLKISDKLRKREEMLREIKKSVIQANSKFQTVKKTKFLYQQKEEAYKTQFLLPKLQQQKRMLLKKKQQMRPMNMTLIIEHQKKYQQKRMNDRINRSLTSRVLQSENHYEPPKFVPKSYLILQAQEDMKQEEEKLKLQEQQVNQFRKKEFLKMMEERHRREASQLEGKLLRRSISNTSLSNDKEGNIKQKYQKISLNRQEAKKVGNSYLNQLKILNRKRAKAKQTVTQMSSKNSLDSKPRARSQYEIELVKEERIEKIQKIRLRKIEDIVNSDQMDQNFKLEKLTYESQKYDQLAMQSKLIQNQQADEIAALYLSSIHTKLAILQMSSPRKVE